MKLIQFRVRKSLLNRGKAMVLILDGNSEKSALVRSNLCYLIFSRHLIRSKAATTEIPIFP